MNLATIIAGMALAFCLFFAIRYMVKEKRKGTRCIGCPAAGSCRKYSCDKNGGSPAGRGSHVR